MTDYLDRMIQRVNGQLPVIKPAVRSSYNTPLLINETKSGFEESVTFEATDTTTIPDLRSSSEGFQASPGLIKRPWNIAAEGENENHFDLTGDRAAALVSDLVKDQGILSSKPSHLSPARDHAPEERPAQQLKARRLVRQPGTNQSVNTVFKNQNTLLLEIPSQTPALIKSSHLSEITGEPSIISGEKQPEYQLSRSVSEQSGPEKSPSIVSEASQRIKKVVQPPIFQTISSGKPDLSLTEKEERAVQKDHNLVKGVRSSGFENAAESRLVKQPFQPDPVLRQSSGERLPDLAADRIRPPTNNITVTIGRVEIKAVNPSHPPVMPIQARSKPKEPAVTLEAYLKARDEVRR